MKSLGQFGQDILRLLTENSITGSNKRSEVHSFLAAFLRILPSFLQLSSPKNPQSIQPYGVFAYLMERYTELCGFDVILIDCSPNNNAINKAAALSWSANSSSSGSSTYCLGRRRTACHTIRARALNSSMSEKG